MGQTGALLLVVVLLASQARVLQEARTILLPVLPGNLVTMEVRQDMAKEVPLVSQAAVLLESLPVLPVNMVTMEVRQDPAKEVQLDHPARQVQMISQELIQAHTTMLTRATILTPIRTLTLALATMQTRIRQRAEAARSSRVSKQIHTEKLVLMIPIPPVLVTMQARTKPRVRMEKS